MAYSLRMNHDDYIIRHDCVVAPDFSLPGAPGGACEPDLGRLLSAARDEYAEDLEGMDRNWDRITVPRDQRLADWVFNAIVSWERLLYLEAAAASLHGEPESAGRAGGGGAREGLSARLSSKREAASVWAWEAIEVVSKAWGTDVDFLAGTFPEWKTPPTDTDYGYIEDSSMEEYLRYRDRIGYGLSGVLRLARDGALDGHPRSDEFAERFRAADRRFRQIIGGERGLDCWHPREFWWRRPA